VANFEDKLSSLEAVVERLERGDLSLEDSVKLFEEGVQLSNACKKELEAAEGKIQLLVDQGRGEMVAKQLEVEGVRLDDEDNEDGE
jgi:exodeoxyribonuclease VII small subunit